MKKIYYLIATAVMALTFASCEDVPSPYGEPTNPNATVNAEPAGTGSVDDPFNVAAAIAKCKEVGSTESSSKYYVKGYAASAATADAQYGNVSFYMTDSQDGKGKKFYAFQAAGPDGQKLTEGYTINVGDEVIVYGPIYNYNGSTPETAGKGAAWVVSVNGSKPGEGGETPAGEAKGSGTQADPYNATAANAYIKTLAADVESDKDIYIKGKLVKYANNGEFSTQYGNASFYLSDDGTEGSEQFYVFRALYLGNKKYTEGETPKVGDEIVICGKVVNYKGNTPETAANKSYIYSLNGQTAGGDEPTPSGDAKGSGTQADPFNVAAAVAKCKETGETATEDIFYVKGIVNAEYTVDSYKNATLVLVDTEGASETFTAFRVKGADGQNLKEGYKIPKGATVLVSGKLVNYKGNTPETAQNTGTLISVNGQAPELDNGSSSGGGDEPTPGGGDAVTSLTNGDFESWTDGLPTGWKSASTASSATLEQSTDAHGGSYAVIVKGDEGSNKRLASQEITLAAGDYTFSFWVKPTSTEVSQVRPGYVPVADGKAGSYAYGDYATLSDGWQQISYSFTLSAETTVCLLVMNPKKSSYSSAKDVIIDDATLTKK